MFCFVLGTDGFSDEMEEELKTYFQSHASNSIECDNGVRISDTQRYAAMIHSTEKAGVVENLIQRVRSSIVFEDFYFSPCSPHELKERKKSENSTIACVTQAEVHRSWEPEVVLPCTKEQCRTASVVSSSLFFVSSSQTPHCEVVDQTDDVIVPHEGQEFLKNVNQNHNSIYFEVSESFFSNRTQASLTNGRKKPIDNLGIKKMNLLQESSFKKCSKLKERDGKSSKTCLNDLTQPFK